MLSKGTVKELGVILKEEFGLILRASDLESFANRLVGLFTVLARLDKEGEVR